MIWLCAYLWFAGYVVSLAAVAVTEDVRLKGIGYVVLFIVWPVCPVIGIYKAIVR